MDLERIVQEEIEKFNKLKIEGCSIFGNTVRVMFRSPDGNFTKEVSYTFDDNGNVSRSEAKGLTSDVDILGVQISRRIEEEARRQFTSFDDIDNLLKDDIPREIGIGTFDSHDMDMAVKMLFTENLPCQIEAVAVKGEKVRYRVSTNSSIKRLVQAERKYRYFLECLF